MSPFLLQDFLTLRGLLTTPAGQNLASRLQQIKFQACHPSHLTKAAELLEKTTGLETFILEHLQIPQAHHHVVKYIKLITNNRIRYMTQRANHALDSLSLNMLYSF